MQKKNADMQTTTTMTSPAEAVDPWVIEQLSKRSKESWVREQLKGYYSKEILDLKFANYKGEFDTRLRALEAGSDDTQRVFIEQRGKWSKAPKRHEMEDLKTAVTGWSTWFRRIIVGVMLFLVGTGGMAVWKYAELNVTMTATAQEMAEVVEENRKLQSKYSQMEKQLDMLRNILQYQQTTYRGLPKSQTGESNAQ